MDNWIHLLLIYAVVVSSVLSVEIHFEAPDSGFFIKHSQRHTKNPLVTAASADLLSSPGLYKGSNQDILSVDRFTVVQQTQPVSIRASYGPFSTKQTVPARYIVPDAAEAQSESIQNATVALLELQQSNVHLDISAHLVRQNIPRDSPVLRVLFHAGADPSGHLRRQKICISLHVSLDQRSTLKGHCIPEGEDGVCVAEVVIPSNWWPMLPAPIKNGRIQSIKVRDPVVQVSYSVFEPPARNPEQCEPKVQIQPITSFAQVPLVAAQSPFKEYRADDTLTILVPHVPLYPMSKIHVPVFIHPQEDSNIAVFIVRVRVKSGIRILGATESSDEWNISIEKENPKHTVARVTAFRKDQDPDSNTKHATRSDSNKITEVFSWLLEVANDTKENWDGGRIVWSVSYVHDGPKVKDTSVENDSSALPAVTNVGVTDDTRKKLVAKLEIQKDDIQAVLPISKNWELLNTAVLTGRQVSQAMKIFIVSQAGKVADVTLQSSCQAIDESVIKVSSSCSSVYVDGTEKSGSLKANIDVSYGNYKGSAKFKVWMPDFPLDISVTDIRLSQIKEWKVPDDHYHGSKLLRRRKKEAFNWGLNEDLSFTERRNCRTKYQQTSIEVYAKFLAIDQDSGRRSYLISQKTGLRVTDLVQPLLRVADPKIATLKGKILQGRTMGRTDIQVISPISGRVMGSREIRVGNDKVSITRLIVRVVSGLQLNITSENGVENGFIAETSVTRKLTAQYQEGLLDIDIEFSDGTRVPLRDVSVDDYFLLVESLDIDVVAFAPMLASHHPRVIAVGEGNGDLLRVTLVLSEDCRMRRTMGLIKPNSKAASPALASALANVQVDFNSLDSRPDTVQNDGITGRDRKPGRDMSDLSDVLIGIPLKDDSNTEPHVQARQHKTGITQINSRFNHPSDMNALEIGMYVLLTAFCFAIIVFVVSCVVYASKFRPDDGRNIPMNVRRDYNQNGHLREKPKGPDSTMNAHDWVWLGRSTMDRNSIIQDNNGNGNGNGGAGNNRNSMVADNRIRITSNPMSVSYTNTNGNAQPPTSFENPNHIDLPSKNLSANINTSTYVKNANAMNHLNNEVPPPLPPHGIHRNPDYRPPVPPHRNKGVATKIPIDNLNGNQPAMVQPVLPPKRIQSRHSRNLSSDVNMNGNNYEVQPSLQYREIKPRLTGRDRERHLNATQQKIYSAFFSDSSPEADTEMNFTTDQRYERYNNYLNTDNLTQSTEPEEKHMAEKLVEIAVQQHKSPFRFDTINSADLRQHKNQKVAENPISDSTNSSPDLDSGVEISECKQQTGDEDRNLCEIKDCESSDDSGGFLSFHEKLAIFEKRNDKSIQLPNQNYQNGNADHLDEGLPCTSNADTTISPNSDLGPKESLGLDDLEMDYDQIMNYFDNLKESNA